ncbi:DoxX family membrane protein [Nocardia yunnanensis]|uniref:DoxX family membrane protein n=1 Tax=Nocardia yunnanensis TaxID=2382165 RepID=A0A386ZGY5_9NOCA|nr:DoxX family protein [Nocardia yunnanensis]AYF75845.1 DoxX family membrane protein [Nocardia yunnanensis]
MFRRVAYPLLAAAFVVDGIETLRNPETRVKSATTLVQRGQSVLPDRVAGALPTDPAQVVRATAAIRVGGGALLMIGRAPRLAALVLAATTIPVTLTEHDFWNEPDRERRVAQRTAFLRDAGLLGGLLIAASDTRGKPSLGWRARRAADRASQRAHELTHKAGDSGPNAVAQLAGGLADRAPAVWEAVRDHGGQLAETAREKGGHLAEVTLDTAREKGGELAEVARDKGEQLAEVVRDKGGQFADVARDKGGQLADVARDKGGQFADVARDKGGQFADVARDKGGQLADVARDKGEQFADVARDKGGQFADVARDKSGQFADVARHRGEHATKVARKRGSRWAARVRPE